MESPKPLPPIAGRGAPTNLRPTRTGSAERVLDGDWLDAAEDIDGDAPPLRTTVTVEHPKTIISRNKSPDISFDRSINPYRGCEHGCTYCFARPTHAFHDLSPGLDFESKLFAKPDAAKLLRAELAKRGYTPAPLAIGTNTDGYQPIERDWGITRSIVEVLAETRHPLIITTKSDRADKVMHMVQDIRGGRDNDPDFFTRMKGHGVWAQLIRTRVKRAAREHGMDRSFPPIRSDLFRPPERDGQMELF